MDQAKAAVKDFMSKAGHHDTTVHEKVAPAVTHETVQRNQHENVNTAIDKEVHQDHYHTSVQPVNDTQILAEQHHHNMVPVEHRSFEHDDPSMVKQKLATEAAQFRDERTRVEGTHTNSVKPALAGEHIHHHVHETIQPVVNRQTIEPHVVHTTVPIHEVHHNAAQHHSTSALPAVSMADFQKQGGVLTGREVREDGFQGEPRAIGDALGGETTGHHGLHSGSHSTGASMTERAESKLSGSHSGTSGLGSSTSRTGESGTERMAERAENKMSSSSRTGL